MVRQMGLSLMMVMMMTSGGQFRSGLWVVGDILVTACLTVNDTDTVSIHRRLDKIFNNSLVDTDKLVVPKIYLR